MRRLAAVVGAAVLVAAACEDDPKTTTGSGAGASGGGAASVGGGGATGIGGMAGAGGTAGAGGGGGAVGSGSTGGGGDTGSGGGGGSGGTMGSGGAGGAGGTGATGSGGSGGTTGSGGAGGMGAGGGGGAGGGMGSGGGGGGGNVCPTPPSNGGPLCTATGVPFSTTNQCPPCAPTLGPTNDCPNTSFTCAYCTGNNHDATEYRCFSGTWTSFSQPAYCADCPLGGGVTPPVGLLTNIDDANCNGSYISPASSENGHLATARLVPAAYPATVGKVRYQIVTNSVCISPAHRVDVFVASSAAPPATPNVIESINVPANAEGPDHKIELTLTNPITLNTGESLFVAIEQKYVSPLDKTCIAACGGSSTIADRNYWSNSPNAPYPWATLASFNLNYNYVVEAYP